MRPSTVRRALSVVAIVVVGAGCRESRDPAASKDPSAEPAGSASPSGATASSAPTPLDAATSAAPVPSASAAAPADDASTFAAGTAGAIMKAGELRTKASYAFQDRDGRTCLDSFDAADKIDPDPTRVSTNPRGFLTMRAGCTMLVGRCEEGKKLQREAYVALLKDMGPSHIDSAVDGVVGNYCGDGAVTPKDKLLVATSTMQRAHLKEDPDACAKAFDALGKVVAASPPPVDKGDEDRLASAKSARMLGPMCVGAAGRCKDAYPMYEKAAQGQGQTPSRVAFEAIVPGCKGK